MNNLYKQIAAGLLAGSLLTGGSAAGTTNYNEGFGAYKQAVQETSRENNSGAYRAYIRSYIDGLKRNYGDLLPRDSSLQFSFNSGCSDAQLYSEASRMHNIAMQNYMHQSKHESKPEQHINYHIVPFQAADGSVYFTDMNGNGRVKMIKNSNGLYSIIGPKDMFEVVYGRGMVDQALKNLSDNDYWRDKKAA